MHNNLPQKWFDERVEAFVDDELDNREKRLFAAQLEQDRFLQREVERARNLQQQLAVIGARCPDNIVDNILQQAQNQPPKRKAARTPVWWSMAAGVGFAALLLLPQPSETPSPDQLQQAQAELRLALGILNSATQQAKSTTTEALSDSNISNTWQQHLQPLLGDNS